MTFPILLNSDSRAGLALVSQRSPHAIPLGWPLGLSLLGSLQTSIMGAVALGGLASCGGGGPTVVRGAGPVVHEQRPLRNNIERVHVEGYVGLAIEILPPDPGALPESSGPETTVFIEGASDLLSWVETELEGDLLSVRFREGVLLDPMPSIEIQMGHLAELSMLGSGDVHLRHIHPLATRGSALTLKAMGSGDIQADGAVDELEISHLGSGDLDLRKLVAGTVAYSGLGSGDTALHVVKSLKSSLKGSGDLRLHGPVPDESVKSSVLGPAKLIRVSPER